MKITILGTGYVGLSTGVCLAEIGHQVSCIDVDVEKVKKLSRAIPTIYEPGLKELLKTNLQANRLSFTTSHKSALKDAEVIMIAVGTPQKTDGSADLSYIKRAAIDIGENLDHDAIIVVKSTVPVGTNHKVEQWIKERMKHPIQITMASNPEFLRQGSAIEDTLHADRIVIGTENEVAKNKLNLMYKPLHIPILHTNIHSAEMIKYASNAFLATKISFINEIANLCEKVGANVEDVANGMGKDKRIGGAFLQAGIGYGGSCFPKDVRALLNTANLYGNSFGILQETIHTNEYQRKLLVEKAIARFGDIKGKKFAMLGLSFKPNTDDMREAPSIVISNLLMEAGASISAYDPVAMENAKEIFKETPLHFAKSVEEAVKDADAMMIVTDWREFVDMDIEKLLNKMKHPIIFDGRNCLDMDKLKTIQGLEYYPVGIKGIG